MGPPPHHPSPHRPGYSSAVGSISFYKNMNTQMAARLAAAGAVPYPPVGATAGAKEGYFRHFEAAYANSYKRVFRGQDVPKLKTNTMTKAAVKLTKEVADLAESGGKQPAASARRPAAGASAATKRPRRG